MTAENWAVLYSFRRCPYAMRARMALRHSGIDCFIREVVLRDKPPQLLAVSPKATVPVLVFADGTVIDESLDIVIWALTQSDPDGWLPLLDRELVAAIDGPFKTHLDRYKYATRYDDAVPHEHRKEAEKQLLVLNERLATTRYLSGDVLSATDIAIAPFVRQFANVDTDWFATTPYTYVRGWLSTFVQSAVFTDIMTKLPQWHDGDEPTLFPG